MRGVTGLIHAQSYKDVFVVICIETMAVFVTIGVYDLIGLV